MKKILQRFISAGLCVLMLPIGLVCSLPVITGSGDAVSVDFDSAATRTYVGGNIADI